MKRSSSESLGSILLSVLMAALLAVLSALVWGMMFAWVVDDYLGNILGREIEFIDLWIVSAMALLFFSSIVNRGST